MDSIEYDVADIDDDERAVGQIQIISANVRKTTVEKRSRSMTQSVRCYNCNNKGHMAPVYDLSKRPIGNCYVCGSMDHQHWKCIKNICLVQSILAG